LLERAETVAEQLNATLCDMRWVKPLDKTLIQEMCATHDLIVTLEENAIAGGAGAAVSEYISEEGLNNPVLHCGLPDIFQDHGKREQLLQQAGLDSDGIKTKILKRMEKLNATACFPLTGTEPKTN
jgi:1-deoxy-D-xylulose-5-phosphate synthase